MRLTDWFGSFSLLAQALVLYLLIVNALTFLLFGLDKLKSASPARPHSERTLYRYGSAVPKERYACLST